MEDSLAVMLGSLRAAQENPVTHGVKRPRTRFMERIMGLSKELSEEVKHTGGDSSDIMSIMSTMFTGAAQNAVTSYITISQGWEGGAIDVDYERMCGKEKCSAMISVTIPPQCPPGHVVLLHGKRDDTENFTPARNLAVTFEYKVDGPFRVEGADIVMNVQMDLLDYYTGKTVVVPIPGDPWTVAVPAGVGTWEIPGSTGWSAEGHTIIVRELKMPETLEDARNLLA